MSDASSSVLGLDRLSNDELLTSTRRLVGCSNHVLAALLGHLGEVEARGIHRERACASLYTYCVYELRMSEDSALRRAKAARVVRQFPALLGAVARGELHLTGLLLLAPHLTEANLVEVMALAKHRTKKEIEKLVRRLDPLPNVPPRIEPLGPAPCRATSSWQAFTTALAGPVRDLVPGDRPSDWVSEPVEGVHMNPDTGVDENAGDTQADFDTTNAAPSSFETPSSLREELPKLEVAERYKVQFTATQEYVDLLQEACDLLSHAAPKAGLDEVHQRALECFVKELRKKKYAESEHPRETRSREAKQPVSREHGRSSRHIPAAVRRRVAARDGRRCSYVDSSGQRCCETRFLEFHHLEAYAHGGPPTEENLALRCRSHNTLAAEEDFGRETTLEKRGQGDLRQRGEADPRQRGDTNLRQHGEIDLRQRGETDLGERSESDAGFVASSQAAPAR